MIDDEIKAFLDTEIEIRQYRVIVYINEFINGRLCPEKLNWLLGFWDESIHHLTLLKRGA